MNSVTERDDAAAVEVYDLKNSTGGQMSIDEFDLEELPTTIDDEGFDVWDLNIYMKKDAADVKNTPSKDTKNVDWRTIVKSWSKT